MKYMCLVLLLVIIPLMFGAEAIAQESMGVEVLKFSWSKERIGWEGDPFRGPIENFDEVRARTRNEKRIEDAKRGNSGEIDKIRREAKPMLQTSRRNTKTPFALCLYLQDNAKKGRQTIKSIDWDYIFRDRATETELNRQQFTSDEENAPGKTRELTVVIRKPPTQTVSVTSLNTSERESLKGEVIIVRIEFTDGTSWQLAQPTP
jgi:hypothetical protein